jgi:hypothetical protein
VTFTTPPPDPDPTKEFVNVTGHVVTNWRQE